MTPRNRTKGPRVRITKPKQLAVNLGLAIKSNFKTQSAAAPELKVAQATLSRLCTGKSPHVYRGVWERIEPLLRPYGDPLDLVLMPSARQSLQDYVDWRDQSLLRLYDDHTRDAGLHVPNIPLRDKEAEIRHLKRRIETEVSEVWEALWELGKTFGPLRISLALLRIVEPLACARESGYVERHESELSSVKRVRKQTRFRSESTDRDEFERFVVAGWHREQILLNREADSLRANRVNSSLPPPKRRAGYSVSLAKRDKVV